MTEQEQTALDSASDRLGSLYQRVGRFLGDPVAFEADAAGVLDEIVELDAEVCRISKRAERLTG